MQRGAQVDRGLDLRKTGGRAALKARLGEILRDKRQHRRALGQDAAVGHQRLESPKTLPITSTRLRN